MIKNKKVAFILFVALVVLFWNILDFLYTSFIAGSAYQFTSSSDLGAPMIFGIMIGYLLFLREKSE